MVGVSIMDLVGPGVESNKEARISESGNISLPLIGPVAHFGRHGTCPASTWLATGHEGLGVTTALATAKLIAAQMLGTPEDLAIDATPYLPARFGTPGVIHGAGTGAAHV